MINHPKSFGRRIVGGMAVAAAATVLGIGLGLGSANAQQVIKIAVGAPLTGAILLRPVHPCGDMIGYTLSEDIISTACAGMPWASLIVSLYGLRS